MADDVTESALGGTIPRRPSDVAGQVCYVTGEDALKLTILNAAAGVTVRVTGRFLDTDDGRVKNFQHDLIPATDRSASTLTRALGVGWLLDLTCIVTAGTPLIGQTFVIAALVRGMTSIALELTTLIQSYVTATQRASFPAGNLACSLDGAGALRSITGTLPAAGAEISETVPAGARWYLIAFEADLATAVAVANRTPQLTIDDGTTILARCPVNQNETASQTWRHSFVQGVPQVFDATRFLIQHPIGCEFEVGPGFRIRTVTALIQAADQWAAPQYLVREKLIA